MVDLKRKVFEALDAVVPGHVYFVTPPADAVEPCVSFLEVENADAVFADDEAVGVTVTYEVDVWAQQEDDILTLVQSVDTALKGMGFDRLHASDLPPDENHLYHKNLQYTQIV